MIKWLTVYCSTATSERAKSEWATHKYHDLTSSFEPISLSHNINLSANTKWQFNHGNSAGSEGAAHWSFSKPVPLSRNVSLVCFMHANMMEILSRGSSQDYYNEWYQFKWEGFPDNTDSMCTCSNDKGLAKNVTLQHHHESNDVTKERRCLGWRAEPRTYEVWANFVWIFIHAMGASTILANTLTHIRVNFKHIHPLRSCRDNLVFIECSITQRFGARIAQP